MSDQLMRPRRVTPPTELPGGETIADAINSPEGSPIDCTCTTDALDIDCPVGRRYGTHTVGSCVFPDGAVSEPCGHHACLGCNAWCVCGHRGCLHHPNSTGCERDCACTGFEMQPNAEAPVVMDVAVTLAPAAPKSTAEMSTREIFLMKAAARGIDLVNNFLPLDPPTPICTIEDGVKAIFAEHNLERLGGASGDLGWSSFSAFQRCPYYWKRMYIDAREEGGEDIRTPAHALELGSLMHVLLAVMYQAQIVENYPLSPESLYNALVDKGCNMEVMLEGWRLFQGYQLRYENDYLIPIAAEYHVVDTATKESARYDLIAKVEDAGETPMIPGVYIVEHKTAAKFDDATLDGWRNDGEVLGQMMLWKRLKLDKKFGKLRGVLVNIIGKQKVQQFHRTVVAPQSWQHKQHAADLKVWHAFRQLCSSVGVYPRARASCIGRYGKCTQFDHCSTGKDEEE